MNDNSLLARLEAVDRLRVAMLDELAAVDGDVLAARLCPDKWSINEIVEHLVLAERGMLRAVTDGPGEAKQRTLKHRVLYPVVMFVLRVDIPVKVPAQAMLPTGERSLEDLRREWDDNHERIRAYAAELDAEGERRAVFAHPVCGPMTPRQAVAMLDVHMRRHFRQIRRILKRSDGAA